jgi:hypothetical protein
MKFINGLNRAVIVIACLVLMVALTALFAFPHEVLVRLGQWMVDWGNYFAWQNPVTRLGVGIALAAVANLLLLIIIFVEVRRRRRRYLRVQQVSGGMATISVESVTELLQYRLDPLAGVISVVPEVRAKGNKVDARVEVGVSRGTHVPETANLLLRTIQSVLIDELGMQIAGQPEVQVTVLTREGETAAPTPPPVPFVDVSEKDSIDESAPAREEDGADERDTPQREVFEAFGQGDEEA